MVESAKFVLPAGLSPDERRQVVAIGNLKKLKYIPDPSFDQPRAAMVLFRDEVDMTDAELTWHKILVNRDLGANEDTSNADKQTLTREEERLVALQYNYAKKVVAEARDRLFAGRLTLRQARKMLVWHQIAQSRKNTFFVANLGLIDAVAKRFNVGLKRDKVDILAEMQDGLLACIEGFDASKGWKFSTYAWRSLTTRVFRAQIRHKKQNFFTNFSFDEDAFHPVEKAVPEDLIFDREKTDLIRDCVHYNVANLSDTELTVIRGRFGFLNYSQEPMTLDELGRQFHLTKERIRQIQNTALEKLKGHLSGAELALD